MGHLFVGLSGYSFKPWQGEGRFYPVGLKQAEFLPFYGDRYEAVEMDGTWYKTPTEEAVAIWNQASPEKFQFSFKLHRRITHLARLKPECYDNVKFMMKRLVPLAASGKVGPFLIQLPPNLKKDEERLANYLDTLPRVFDEIEGYTGPMGVPARWAVEFRHPSWNCEEVSEIMQSRNVAWVASDTDELPATRKDTADFHYVRIRRTDTDQTVLDDWSTYFGGIVEAGKDCYVFCKHEDEGSPWEWADYLKRSKPTQ